LIICKIVRNPGLIFAQDFLRAWFMVYMLIILR